MTDMALFLLELLVDVILIPFDEKTFRERRQARRPNPKEPVVTDARTPPKVELRLNDDPRYTEAHVEHQRKYWYAFGMSWCPSDDEFAAQLAKIRAGNPDRRHDVRTECHDIFVDGEEAGSVVVTDGGELLLVVFDRFAHRGVGRTAVRMYLARTTREALSAQIRRENQNPEGVAKLLESVGFNRTASPPGGDIHLCWTRATSAAT